MLAGVAHRRLAVGGLLLAVCQASLDGGDSAMVRFVAEGHGLPSIWARALNCQVFFRRRRLCGARLGSAGGSELRM